jgi:hypothetical protein
VLEGYNFFFFFYAQACFKLVILLLQPSEYYNYKGALPYLFWDTASDIKNFIQMHPSTPAPKQLTASPRAPYLNSIPPVQSFLWGCCFFHTLPPNSLSNCKQEVSPACSLPMQLSEHRS